ncbi:MAG: hypothetical protein ABIG61_12250 [Planctomycetota bacterium]
MAMELKQARAPAYLKLAFYGTAGSGKTYTAAIMLSQFIKEYAPDLQLAMFDTEGGAGFIAEIVQELSGKPLMSIAATSFGELREFLTICPGKYIGLIDSATHPWRTLCEDYLDSKRSRVKGAGGNPETTRLALADWGPIKEIWNKGFSDPYKYLPAHFCYCGRAGDKWETIEDEEGNKKLESTGTRMKIESESAYEPSLLIEMILSPNPLYAQKKSGNQWLHRAEVVKDRHHLLTGQVCNNPDLRFIKSHVDFLIGGEHQAPNTKPPVTFKPGEGRNWETIKKQRQAILEEIKDDLLLAFPGQTAAEKKAKVSLLRKAFETSSWSALENDDKHFSVKVLKIGRDKLQTLISEIKEVDNAKNSE